MLAVATACTDPIGPSTSSSSSSGCPGDGGITPVTPGPQALPPRQKFVAEQMSKVAPGTSMVAVVNELCVLQQKAQLGLGAKGQKNFSVSAQLIPQVEAQSASIKERAYVLPWPKGGLDLAALENDQCLVQIEPEVFATVDQVQPSATVNDPFYSLQSHLTAIDASTGWDTLLSGLSVTTTIAIIDDGVELTHPDLSGVLWTNPTEIAGNSIDDDGNGYTDDVYGYNFGSSLGSPAHQSGKFHGTHVAGLAGAQSNNSVGITGVLGQNVNMMHLNVFGTSTGASSANIVNAINYAVSKGAHVINMSLGGLGTSTAVRDAMISAAAAGTFIAVSAGNSNEEVTSSNFYMPMGYARDISGAMSVGSVDALTLARSAFSNYSTTYVEITAPGSDSRYGGVYSTYTSASYNYLQGTSMSSPVVAGAAALLIGWVRSQGGTITAAQVESTLRSGAVESSALTSYVEGGRLLNLSSLASSAQCVF